MDIHDQGDDANGQQLFQWLRLFDAPSFVKSASLADTGDCRGLANHLYADPGHRRFPCDTPAATWISAAFFFDQHDQLPPKVAAWTERRLEEFAAYHKIGHTLEQLRRKIAEFKQPHDPNELRDSDFAIIRRDEAGNTTARQYPIHNAISVKVAAQYLVDYYNEFAYSERQQFAQKVLEKAAAYGATISPHMEFLERQAGLGACSADDVATMLLNRARAIGRGGSSLDMQRKLAGLARTCLEKPVQLHDRGMRIKLATLIDQYDREYKLAHTELLPAPEEVLFKITPSVASKLATELCETATGSVYPVDVFSELKLRDIADNFGQDFAESVTADGLAVSAVKLASAVQTLPHVDAAEFDRFMSELGIPTELQLAAFGMPESDWNALASA